MVDPVEVSLNKLNEQYFRIYSQQLCEDLTEGRSGVRRSGISVLVARQDDDDIYKYIHSFIYI